MTYEIEPSVQSRRPGPTPQGPLVSSFGFSVDELAVSEEAEN